MSSNDTGPGILRYGQWPIIRYSVLIIAIAGASLFLWPGLLKNLFSEDFMPHGACLLWEPKLLWLHIVSDTSIGLSYVAISLTLAWLVHRARKDIPFQWIFLAFGLFIIACGSTHLMEVVTLWQPFYWLSGDIKLITAIASVATAIVLPPLVPKTIAMIQAAKLSDERKLRIEAQNRDLEEMTQKLCELDELKTQFFANVSHELRTPLALMLGRTEKLLASDAVDQDARRELAVVHRNARSLLKQVNDLLDISKLTAGRMSMDYSCVDLAQLVRRTCANFDSLASDRRIDYKYEGPDSLEAEIDAEKYERILLNLLSNAFKFTPDGGHIRCELAREGSTAVLAIVDSGPGIRPEMRDVIFERFRQLEGGVTRRFGGTGLGLAIVKDFVELHHGRVDVKDAPGGGAHFTVRVPVRAPQGEKVASQRSSYGGASADNAEERTTQAVEELQSGRPEAPAQAAEVESALSSAPLVLVVEDNPDMNRFIVESLAGEYRVTTAFDGKTGLEKAVTLKPDVVLSDIMMPEMSGEDLLRELRSHPELAWIPVILLTAKADPAHRLRVLREGAQDYIMKPFSVEELRVRIHNLASVGQARRVLQQELNSHTNDVEQLAHEVSVRRRQLDSVLDALRASESRFRRLVESNIIGVITVGLDGAILEANDAFLRMTGYTRDDLAAGRINWREMTEEQYLESDLAAMQQLEIAGVAPAWQKEYVRKDGSRVPVLVGAAKVEGGEQAAIAFVLDLTEQKRTQARVVVQYEIARILAGSSDVSDASVPVLRAIGQTLGWDYGEMWVTDDEHSELRSVQTWTGEGLKFSEFEASTHSTTFARSEGLPGRVWVDSAPYWMPSLDDDGTFKRAGLAIKVGLRSAFGFPILVNNDVVGVLTFFSHKAQQSDRDVLDLMAGIGHQIGQFIERKRGEAALRESERRMRTVIEAVPQMVWTARADGSLDFYNQRWYDYTGLTYEQTRGWGWQPVLHPEDLSFTLAQWTDAVQTGKTYQVQSRLRSRDGLYRWYLIRAVPLRDQHGQILKWFGTATDIDEQKRAEAAKSELAAIVESSDDAIIGKTLDGKITTWNRGAELIYGYKAEEIIGKPVWVLNPPERMEETQEILARLARGERIEHLQTVRWTKDQRRIDVSLSVSAVRNASGEVVGASTIARDVTELRRAEGALRNSEKHATVGRLAATMAHEINNPLEAVSNVLYLLENRPDLDEQAKLYVSIASQEIERIAHIVKQTLGFYRESVAPVLINVPELIESVLSLYSRKLQNKSIQLDKRIESVPEVPGFAGEMRQVLSNIIINAIEAMPEDGKLTIHISSSMDWVNTSRRGVRLVVCDNGSGISPEHRRNLFEPFFTTKGEKGTGLGLWVSYGIVQKHGGSIRFRSCTGPARSGTCFSIFLPSEMPGADASSTMRSSSLQPTLFTLHDRRS